MVTECCIGDNYRIRLLQKVCTKFKYCTCVSRKCVFSIPWLDHTILSDIFSEIFLFNSFQCRASTGRQKSYNTTLLCFKRVLEKSFSVTRGELSPCRSLSFFRSFFFFFLRRLPIIFIFCVLAAYLSLSLLFLSSHTRKKKSCGSWHLSVLQTVDTFATESH